MITNHSGQTECACLRLMRPTELYVCGQRFSGQRWTRLISLVAYVALEGPVSRVEMAALLWPAVSRSRQGANLRQLLHLVRQRIGSPEGRLWSDCERQLALHDSVVCDLLRIRQFTHGHVEPEVVREVFDRISGPFLQGVELPEGEFADWVRRIREETSRQVARICNSYGMDACRSGDTAEAQAWGRISLRIAASEQELITPLVERLAASGEPLFDLPGIAQREPGSDKLSDPVSTVEGAGQHDLEQMEWRQLAVLAITLKVGEAGAPKDDDEWIALVSHQFVQRLTTLLRAASVDYVTVIGTTTLIWFGHLSNHYRPSALGAACCRFLLDELADFKVATCALHYGRALVTAKALDLSGTLTRDVLSLLDGTEPGKVALSAAAVAVGLVVERNRPRLPLEEIDCFGCEGKIARIEAIFRANAAQDSQPSTTLTRQVRSGTGADAVCSSILNSTKLQSGGVSPVYMGDHDVPASNSRTVGVLLVGGATTGKSHLLARLIAQRGEEPTLLLESNPMARNRLLYPLLAATTFPPVWSSLLARVEQVAWQLPAATPQSGEVPLIGQLIELLLDQLPASMMIAIEDLHWADRATLQLIELLCGDRRAKGWQIVATARPGRDWRALLPALKVMPIERLDDTAAAAIVRYHKPWIGEEELTESLLSGSGNPGLLNEYGRLSADIAMAPLLIEMTMQQVDGLSQSDRQLLQMAAMLGEQIEIDWLKRLAPGGGEARLASLVRSGLLRQGTETTVSFRHERIRQAVLDALPPRRLVDAYHQLGSEVIRRLPELALHYPERVACWLTAGADWEGALPWRILAAEQALAVGAYCEASDHYRYAIELLRQLPSEERFLRQERDLRIRYGPVEWLARGDTDPEDSGCQPLLGLCRDLGEPAAELEALFGSGFHVESTRGERGVASMVRRMVRCRMKQGGSQRRYEGRIAEWRLHYYLFSGQFRRAEAVDAVRWTDAYLSPNVEHVRLHNPGAGILVRLSLLDSYLARCDRARNRSSLVQEMVGESGDRITTALVLRFLLIHALDLGQRNEAWDLLQRLHRLEGALDHPVNRAVSVQALGRIALLDGAPADTVSRLEPLMQRISGLTPIYGPVSALSLAVAALKLGDHHRAAYWVKQAGEQIASRSILIYRCDYYLARARLLLATDRANLAAASELIQRAIDVACRQGSPLLQERASALADEIGMVPLSRFCGRFIPSPTGSE